MKIRPLCQLWYDSLVALKTMGPAGVVSVIPNGQLRSDFHCSDSSPAEKADEQVCLINDRVCCYLQKKQ